MMTALCAGTGKPASALADDREYCKKSRSLPEIEGKGKAPALFHDVEKEA